MVHKVDHGKIPGLKVTLDTTANELWKIRTESKKGLRKIKPILLKPQTPVLKKPRCEMMEQKMDQEMETVVEQVKNIKADRDMLWQDCSTTKMLLLKTKSVTDGITAKTPELH